MTKKNKLFVREIPMEIVHNKKTVIDFISFFSDYSENHEQFHPIISAGNQAIQRALLNFSSYYIRDVYFNKKKITVIVTKQKDDSFNFKVFLTEPNLFEDAKENSFKNINDTLKNYLVFMNFTLNPFKDKSFWSDQGTHLATSNFSISILTSNVEKRETVDICIELIGFYFGYGGYIFHLGDLLYTGLAKYHWRNLLVATDKRIDVTVEIPSLQEASISQALISRVVGLLRLSKCSTATFIPDKDSDGYKYQIFTDAGVFEVAQEASEKTKYNG